MKKRYKLESGVDLSITLEIDTDKIPEELARKLSSFGLEGDRTLELSGGDAHQALARCMAGPLLVYLLDGYHESAAVEYLVDEGWLYEANGGITIIDHKIPTLSAGDFEVKQILPHRKE